VFWENKVRVRVDAPAWVLPRAYFDVSPDDTRNVATPISINDMPKFSVFAWYLGNTGKSTAKIAMHVSKTFMPLNILRKL